MRLPVDRNASETGAMTAAQPKPQRPALAATQRAAAPQLRGSGLPRCRALPRSARSGQRRAQTWSTTTQAAVAMAAASVQCSVSREARSCRATSLGARLTRHPGLGGPPAARG